MAHLRHEPERPRKPWRVDWTERRQRHSRRFASKREASIFLGKVEAGEHPDEADRTILTDWIVTWIAETGLTWEPRTRADRASYADRFIVPHLGRLRLSEITRADVRRWRAAIVRGGASPYTADRSLSVLSAALGEAVREGLIRTNPCREQGRLARPVKRRQPATLDQVEGVRAHLSAPADRAFVSLMAYAGLRPSEARALQWDDVGERTIVVRAALGSDGREKGTKTGGVRSVPLIGPVREDCAATDRDGPQVPVLGPPVDHRNWTKRVWRPACERAGAVITPYQLRHTFASLQIAAGRNAWQVAALMGHANPQMVLTVYGHLFAEAELADPQPVEEAAKAARQRAASRSRRAAVTGP